MNPRHKWENNIELVLTLSPVNRLHSGQKTNISVFYSVTWHRVYHFDFAVQNSLKRLTVHGKFNSSANTVMQENSAKL